MNVNEILSAHRDEIRKRFGVKRIGLFGSCARGDEGVNSDADILVEFETPDFNNFMELIFYLEELLGRPVDVLTPEGLKAIRIPEVRGEIQREVVYV